MRDYLRILQHKRVRHLAVLLKLMIPRLHSLLGGLGISEAELTTLFDLLADQIQFNANSKTSLGLLEVSLLYRHALLARALKLKIEDLAHLLRLKAGTKSPGIMTADQILDLIELSEWLRTSPFNVESSAFILLGEESASVKFVSNRRSAANIVTGYQNYTKTEEGEESFKTYLSLILNIKVAQLHAILKWAEIRYLQHEYQDCP